MLALVGPSTSPILPPGMYVSCSEILLGLIPHTDPWSIASNFDSPMKSVEISVGTLESITLRLQVIPRPAED